MEGKCLMKFSNTAMCGAHRKVCFTFHLYSLNKMCCGVRLLQHISEKTCPAHSNQKAREPNIRKEKQDAQEKDTLAVPLPSKPCYLSLLLFCWFLQDALAFWVEGF